MRTTLDSIALRGAGVIQIAQPVQGHRFTLDSILLADFCRVRTRDRVLETGAGAGILSLLLAKKHSRAHFTAVEIQKTLHDLCTLNIETNGIQNLRPMHKDIRQLTRSSFPDRFDVMVANPPYARTGTGRTSPDTEKRAAREDLHGSIEQWLDLQKFLNQGGRYCMVFAASRLAELFSLMRARRLEPKRLRQVHPATGKPALLALIEAVKDGGTGLMVLPPLIVHGPDGGYTREMREIYGE